MRGLHTSPVFPGISPAPWQPMARLDQLVMTHLDDEILVYDQTTHAIHRLNPTAAAIWRLCDGRRTVDDLVRCARVELGPELDFDGVRVALTKLVAVDLIDGPPDPAAIHTGSSRRTVIARAATAGAVAMIVSVTAPVAAAAVSLTCAGPTNVETCRTGTGGSLPTGTPCCKKDGTESTCQPAGSFTWCGGQAP